MEDLAQRCFLHYSIQLDFREAAKIWKYSYTKVLTWKFGTECNWEVRTGLCFAQLEVCLAHFKTDGKIYLLI